MNPLVSAIIPTYDRADLLARALDSVLAQSYRPIEAIVVDDGSTDHTPEIIDELRPRMARRGVGLIFHRQPNGGAPRARNNGMRLATGALFAFLDSDDLWRPAFVGTLVRLLRDHPAAALAFSGILVIDDDDRVWDMRKTQLEDCPDEGALHRPFERILWHMPLQTSGVMVRRATIHHVGDFDLDLPVVEDWDLWYRIARHHDFAYTKDALAANRVHPRNLPKYDSVALASGIRMNLKHLPEVRDPRTRQMLIDRTQRQFVLLQEELLRKGQISNPAAELLYHDLAPRTPRFELGAMIAQGPAWAGKSYAWLVQRAGILARGFT